MKQLSAEERRELCLCCAGRLGHLAEHVEAKLLQDLSNIGECIMNNELPDPIGVASEFQWQLEQLLVRMRAWAEWLREESK